MDLLTLAQMIDHTNLHADASYDDMKKLCQEAVTNHFKMVAINSVQTSLCHQLLAGTPVHTGAAIGFPLGQQTIETKLFETTDALKNGADEIDYVINITEVKEKHFDYIEKEMHTLVQAVRAQSKIIKVIFENCYLTKDEIVTLATIAKKVKPDFIKTSTGFGKGGATEEDVRLMKETVGDEVGVKAAGGIRSYEDAMKMIAAGATRIGTSHGVEIISQAKEY